MARLVCHACHRREGGAGHVPALTMVERQGDSADSRAYVKRERRRTFCVEGMMRPTRGVGHGAGGLPRPAYASGAAGWA
ncbi:hypothetical protein C2I33_18985 [Ralstonia solanacearum]|nr:hypothetical protein C2I33_18985 [Ralstonia solanacearum]